jgi:hypothetical protein
MYKRGFYRLHLLDFLIFSRRTLPSPVPSFPSSLSPTASPSNHHLTSLLLPIPLIAMTKVILILGGSLGGLSVAHRYGP